MVVTIWVAEHEGEVGIILLNDYVLGDLFGGQAGFEAELAKQGFTNVRNMESPLQFERERAKRRGMTDNLVSGVPRIKYVVCQSYDATR